MSTITKTTTIEPMSTTTTTTTTSITPTTTQPSSFTRNHDETPPKKIYIRREDVCRRDYVVMNGHPVKIVDVSRSRKVFPCHDQNCDDLQVSNALLMRN